MGGLAVFHLLSVGAVLPDRTRRAEADRGAGSLRRARGGPAQRRPLRLAAPTPGRAAAEAKCTRHVIIPVERAQESTGRTLDGVEARCYLRTARAGQRAHSSVGRAADF